MASTMAAQPSEGNLLHSGRASATQTGRTGRTGRRVSAAVVSDEQLDSLLHDDWQDDAVKSLSRRVVEGFLSKVSPMIHNLYIIYKSHYWFFVLFIKKNI